MLSPKFSYSFSKNIRGGSDMKEKENYFAWYRLRGLGLICLCSLVFFFGAYLANQGNAAVSSTVSTQALPINCVDTKDKKIALSFDVADINSSTQVILSILEKYGVKAAFFVTGSWAETHPDELKSIAAAGHDLGNRGPNRKSMSGLAKAEAQKEIEEVHNKVRELTGISMNLFRAPYGEYDSALVETVKASGYLPIRWNVDSEDWKDYGVESIIKKVTENENLKAGSIIRMHSGAKYTSHALETVITSLQQQGYELVPLSQLIYHT